VIEPPPPRARASVARRLLAVICSFDILLPALVFWRPALLDDLFPGLARLSVLSDLFPGLAGPAVLQVAFGVTLLILTVASFADWRSAMRRHRAALAEADGVDR